MLINADLNTVPDTRPLVPAGIYEMRIMEVSEKAPQNAATKGINIVTKLEVINHPEHNGRQMTLYTFITDDAGQKDRFTGVKRLFLSAGIPLVSTGMNTNDLAGKVITVEVTSGTYPDKNTGVMKESSNISRVFIPSDNVKPGHAPGGATLSNNVDISSVIGGTPAPEPQPAAQPA
jgi:hypothetical protein